MKILGLRRNLWVTFGHRTDHGPTHGADRAVRSITEPIANERSEGPFDRGSDANDPRKSTEAVGREINQCFSGEAMQRDRENTPGKRERQRYRMISLETLSTGAAEPIVAVIPAETTHRFPGRGKILMVLTSHDFARSTGQHGPPDWFLA